MAKGKKKTEAEKFAFLLDEINKVNLAVLTVTEIDNYLSIISDIQKKLKTAKEDNAFNSELFALYKKYGKKIK